MKEVAISFEHITKKFGQSVIANSDVTFDIYKGEILSLLGENGSGKTTLMNMLAGIYYPDEGHIYINGKKENIASPMDAFNLHIGMIHQHFKLVDVFTCLENIVLGVKDKEKSNLKKARILVKNICLKYGFDINLDKKVYDMSVSEKQTLEIVKALYRDAEILILDEPTAVLTPLEIKKLFDVLRNMRAYQKTVIIITHKLNEVMEISDRVAVLRKGEYIGAVETKDTDEMKLTEMMVGKKVDLLINRTDIFNPEKRLSLNGLSLKDSDGVQVLDDVSFDVYSNEILGIAGISGSGQKELLECIAGLIKLDAGDVIYSNPDTNEDVDLRSKTPLQIRELGVRLSFVPEDRLGMGLVGNMDIIDNMMLRSYGRGHKLIVDRKNPRVLADRIIEELEVKTPSNKTAVRKLSGGNVQKVLVGREIAQAPKVLMAAYPVRGLDINSSYVIYNLLNSQKEQGVAVIFVGEDLDVLLALCDRIVVVASGKVTGIVDARTTTKEEVGRLMVSDKKMGEESNE